MRRLGYWVLLLSTALVPRAEALTACSAANISSQEAGCPLSGACTITKTFTIGNGCVLDFSGRDVTLAAAAQLDIGSGAVTLRTRNFTMIAGAFIDGRGVQAAPNDIGGSVTVNASGTVTLQKSGFTRARIEVSGNSQAGVITISADGDIINNGKMEAAQLTGSGNGGRITMAADGNISSGLGSEFTATGGYQSVSGGGAVDFDAGGSIQLGDVVDVSGSLGGTIDLSAGLGIATSDLRGNGTGDSGPAGTVTITAGLGVDINGPIVLRGSEYNVTAGGDGGAVTISALYGNLNVAQDIFAEGGNPDGDGGELDIDVRGAMNVLTGATVSVRSNGLVGLGGSMTIAVGTDLTTAALIDASGGGGGGDIDIDAGGNITLGGDVDATGRYNEGFGGDIGIEAGEGGSGSLTVLADVNVSGGLCDIDGCGDAGGTDLRGCNVTVAATGRVVARAPGVSGQNQLTAREVLRIDGTVNATKTVTSGADGSNIFMYPNTHAPIIRVGGVAPVAGLTAMEPCSPSVTMNCLMPCPTCGNGFIEFPEECDDGARLSCDGCSVFCANEVCDPGTSCAAACDPTLGCPPPPSTPCPQIPTPTPSAAPPSRTPTPTLAPGAPTYTETSTPTATRTSTATPTITNTPTPTLTATATSTRTATNTPVSTHDAVIFPIRPLQVVFDGASDASKVVLIRVGNGETADTTARPIQLVAGDGDCPNGTIDGIPDLDPVQPGNQDTVPVIGGKTVLAAVPLRITAAAFHSLNRKSPQRCTLTFEVNVPLAGNLDPSPDNNVLTAELNVVDESDIDPEVPHQTAIGSVAPLKIKIGRNKTEINRRVLAFVTNADVSDVAGHAITLQASDGDCPTGTLGLPIFHRPSAIAQNSVPVKNMKSRRGTIPVLIRAADFAGGTPKSPRRCTALLVATGPSGDTDVSNNVTLLQIDVSQN